MREASDLLRELQAQWPMVEKKSPADSFYDKRPGLRPPKEMVCAVNRERMTVKPGVDPSTWNTVAGAYNNAWSGWINALAACGALEALDVACLPKVMRLMAADLVAWHGAQLHVDTAVAAALPWPSGPRRRRAVPPLPRRGRVHPARRRPGTRRLDRAARPAPSPR